uniref:Radial spoke head protein 9 homolog n=1 Tax=Macrostomum lignano TaxID=282301 RepID=A0A1I8FA82_9PLAT
MESTTFKSGLEYLGGSGVVLSPEQRAKLQTSLVILKQEQKFQKVYLWGRISGIKDDYFIAKGVGQDELSDTRALYSKDCMEWGVLPVATPEIKAKAALARAGSPATVARLRARRVEANPPGEGETERLAAVVAEIDSDVAIVPRGAFVRTPNGHGCGEPQLREAVLSVGGQLQADAPTCTFVARAAASLLTGAGSWSSRGADTKGHRLLGPHR